MTITAAADGYTVVLKPEQLYLGFDGLKDEYTLCGTILTESPHYELMGKMNKTGSDFQNCNYILRKKYGYLDGLMGCIVDSKQFEAHRNCFAKSLESIRREKQKEVLVYTVAGEYYILDGKHTASLCAVLGKEIKCRLVDLGLMNSDSYNKRLLAHMEKHPKLYGKNMDLLNAIMKRK